MQDIETESDILHALIERVPLLDVRAPAEFVRGAFPDAHNLPLLDDAQREAVGKTYRHAGQAAAIELGESMISGEVRQQRMAQWQQFVADNPGALLYCFRGGQRSRIVQDWLAGAGTAIPRISGGYKRMRRILITRLEAASREMDCIIVAGKTGSGKTHLINRLPHSLDLEGLANHRGSAFGKRYEPQPSQVDFENALTIDLLRKLACKPIKLFLEDESRAIGSLSIPTIFHDRMRQAPLAVIETSVAERSRTIMNDYILSNYADFSAQDPLGAANRFCDSLLGNLERIQRRLGGEKYRQVANMMEHALVQQFEANDPEAHLEWIQTLLETYYDPMYEYQLNKKLERVVFRGNHEEFLSWAAHFDHAQAS